MVEDIDKLKTTNKILAEACFSNREKILNLESENENLKSLVSFCKSNAERQKALRKRMKEQGLKEIRNIYATPEHEKLIKEYAKSLQEKGND